MKIRPRTLKNEESERLLYEAHELAVSGLPYFANLTFGEQENASYAANGLRFGADWKEDWELDTVRACCIDRVTLNLPRVAYEAGKDKAKFFENLYDISEKGLRSLEIKYYTMWRRAEEGFLPFIRQKGEQDPYVRLENSSCLLSFVGLNETAQKMTGKTVDKSEEALKFAEEILIYLSKLVKGHAKKRKIRFALGLTPNLDAAKRLAELDIERYGLAEVHVKGDRDEPYYSNMTVVPFEAEMPLENYLQVPARFHAMTPGGHLVKIRLEEYEEGVDSLFSTTKKILEKHQIGLYTYDKSLTYCSYCRKTFRGEQIKCLVCGSVNAVTRFRREPARYKVIWS